MVLLGAITWLVVRQVVTPVRMAAGIAERLSAGRLQERMKVTGEDDIARLGEAFNKMAQNLQLKIQQLEDLSRMQRRFVSDVSHELRTPLTDRPDGGRRHPRRACGLRSGDRSVGRAPRRSAGPVRDAARGPAGDDRFQNAGAAALEAEAIDLREVVRRVVSGAEPLAERKGSQIRVVGDQQPVVAEADARRVERVLRNLVVNAVEHGDGKEVVVKLATAGGAVAIAVRDYGVGLKPGEATRVFSRFWRADPARARTTGGTGLGLSIALEDARLHGGWLQAWGEPGGGSQFRLTLPRTADEPLRVLRYLWSPWTRGAIVDLMTRDCPPAAATSSPRCRCRPRAGRRHRRCRRRPSFQRLAGASPGPSDGAAGQRRACGAKALRGRAAAGRHAHRGWGAEAYRNVAGTAAGLETRTSGARGTRARGGISWSLTAREAAVGVPRAWGCTSAAAHCCSTGEARCRTAGICAGSSPRRGRTRRSASSRCRPARTPRRRRSCRASWRH